MIHQHVMDDDDVVWLRPCTVIMCQGVTSAGRCGNLRDTLVLLRRCVVRWLVGVVGRGSEGSVTVMTTDWVFQLRRVRLPEKGTL
jgi:hypothetical protein